MLVVVYNLNFVNFPFCFIIDDLCFGMELDIDVAV